MSASAELQRAIYGLLTTNAGVRALVDTRVYDGMPEVGQYPCITFGASDYSLNNMECIKSRTESIQLDVWSRDQGRMWKCREIVDAVKAALHKMPFSMNGAHLVELRVELVRVFRDGDGITAHGVVQVEADVNEG